MFSKRILATMLTLSMLFSFGFLVSCSEQSNGPSAPKFETTNQTVPVTPQLKDLTHEEFMEEIWESIFSTQYNAATSTYWLNTELGGSGTYNGVNSEGEAFELEVVDFISYKNTTALLADITDPAVAAAVAAVAMTQSRAEAYLRVGRNEVLVSLITRAGTESGSTTYPVFPMGYFVPLDPEAGLPDLPDVEEGSPDGGSASGLLGLAQDEGFQEECEEANSKHANPPNFICYGDRIKDEECQEACDAAYTSAMEGHISDFCSDLEDAYDTYDAEWQDCEDEFYDCLLVKFIEWTLIPAGCFEEWDDCQDDANEAKDAAHASLSGNLEGDRDGELDTWKDCSKECCSDPPKVEPKKKKEVELDNFNY
ncbi:MAG: hypothetical protein HKN21_07795 [Candidatus Eisenbacteria bacterium]|uniref:Uncharacterized protein n=1 Tax=Eiseniibacteriota bacterium TaxID=2212470 RepID=A0A7Y2E990_UNCEI|nr:hypothetical protein [Candidatus Eisenbacteria bacterium]